MLFESITGDIIDAAMIVHSALGPGLFEQAYKVCLRHELLKREIKVLSEVGLPVTYDGTKFEVGYRIDLLVENTVIVELKSVERIAPIHKAQLLTYLKLAQLQVGLILNFNVPHLKQGILRVANTFPPPRRPAYSAL
jgi:GxxExxY protein